MAETRWTVLIKTPSGFKVANGPRNTIAWTYDRKKAEAHAGAGSNRRVVDADALSSTKTVKEVEALWNAHAPKRRRKKGAPR